MNQLFWENVDLAFFGRGRKYFLSFLLEQIPWYVILILFPEKLQTEMGKQRWLVCMSVHEPLPSLHPWGRRCSLDKAHTAKATPRDPDEKLGRDPPKSHLSTGGTSKVQSHAGTFTLHNLPPSVSVGTPVSPRRMPKMGADGSSAPLGGRRGSV